MIPSSGSSRRAKCSLETAVVTVELFEVEEKKPELLAAHAAGPAGHAASSSGFFSSMSKSSTVTTAISSEHFARLLEPDDGIKESVSEL